MRRAIAALVATVGGLVMLLSFKTASSKSIDRPVALSGTTAGTSASDPSPTAVASPSASASPSVAASPSASASAAATTKAKSSGTTKTVTGSSVSVSEGFRTFGSVQVEVTLVNGKITKLVAVDYPNRDPRSSEISQYSIPVLAQEVLAAQGTNIDVISGATYTTQAYAQSVQAALDSAKS